MTFPPVRPLGPGDLKRCVALSVDRGWSPEQAKWSLLLAASEVFGVDAPDGGGLAGAVVLTRWAADYAAIGMMLVAARYGRRGLGRALMEHALRAAGGDATVTLFATDMGRPLYEKLGFVAVRRNVSFVGRFRPSPARDSGRKREAPALDASPTARPGASAPPPGRTCPRSSPWTGPRSARTGDRSSPACPHSRTRSPSSRLAVRLARVSPARVSPATAPRGASPPP